MHTECIEQTQLDCTLKYAVSINETADNFDIHFRDIFSETRKNKVTRGVVLVAFLPKLNEQDRVKYKLLFCHWTEKISRLRSNYSIVIGTIKSKWTLLQNI
jgi:hypothetical protein